MCLHIKLLLMILQFEKLMKLFKNGHNLISKQFGCPQAPTVTWELHVYPNGKREEDAGNVSFFLRQVGLQVGSFCDFYSFSFVLLLFKHSTLSNCIDLQVNALVLSMKAFFD